MNKPIHYQADVLERFIPISIDRLITDILNKSFFSSKDKPLFKQFQKSYIALFHAQAHEQLLHLKHIYRPFNPDREVLIPPITQVDKPLTELKQEMATVLNNANFEKLSEQDLNEALNKISPRGVKVTVNFDEFVEVGLYYRGSAIRTEYHRNWKKIPFKKEAVEMPIYRRLFVMLHPKNKQQWIEHLVSTKKISREKAEKQADEAIEDLGINGEKDVIYLKLFKDIPSADLEMLFPNTKIQMRLFDKIKLGVLGGGGTAGGVMATITKLSAAIDPISAIMAVGSLLGIIWRQIAKVFSQRAKYSAALTKNLYFYSLDNNMGALTHLVDAAETEECKEALLAYSFLLTGGESSRADLDKRIESYLFEQYDIPMDFEIDDGLQKLQNAGLLESNGNTIRALPLTEANTKLEQHWNNVIKTYV